ncbi:glucose galactose transporter protein [Rutstroemia sp. NJR-2017a BVV2]|nr:glucose galactose transporter protein [Rutstroemia sp. NJR-2017a BVV2]
MLGSDFWKRRTLRVRDDRRNAAEITLRESIFPICLVTVLFFLWGFSYSLLDTLNKHFQTTLHITRARSSGLQAAYFGAYPFASLGHAAWILRHYSYRAVFIWGLFLYGMCMYPQSGLGALLAIAAIKHQSFGGFCACIFIIGNGLGSLETAANPYITVCGPPKYAEIRINISQAFNGIGTVISPVLGSYVFFTFSDARALQNVQWVYLAIAVFVFILAIIFFFSHIPEITDADMEFQAQETHAGADELPFRKQYKLFHAAFAQFCYTGAQVAIAGYFINYVTETRAHTSSALGANFLAGAQASFAVGRFAGVGLMYIFRPRWVFGVYMVLAMVFLAPAITQRGNTGMAMLYICLFFESICFPTIVALGMKGLGRHTKRGSGWIVGGVLGGACVPPLTGVAADRYGTGLAMFVPMCFFVGSLTYAIAVNFVPYYKKTVDALTETDIGLHTADEEAARSETQEEKAAAAFEHKE